MNKQEKSALASPSAIPVKRFQAGLRAHELVEIQLTFNAFPCFDTVAFAKG